MTIGEIDKDILMSTYNDAQLTLIAALLKMDLSAEVRQFLEINQVICKNIVYHLDDKNHYNNSEDLV
tara:strand:+ start:2647 stop:2847 length:201 start_codon:yes stop_codon:yes gene_type:complete